MLLHEIPAHYTLSLREQKITQFIRKVVLSHVALG